MSPSPLTSKLKCLGRTLSFIFDLGCSACLCARPIYGAVWMVVYFVLHRNEWFLQHYNKTVQALVALLHTGLLFFNHPGMFVGYYIDHVTPKFLFRENDRTQGGTSRIGSSTKGQGTGPTSALQLQNNKLKLAN